MKLSNRLPSGIVALFSLSVLLLSCMTSDKGASSLKISYKRDTILAVKGVAIIPDTLVLTGGSVTGFIVSPLLPAGLTMDPSTGLISGIPLVTSTATRYTVVIVGSGVDSAKVVVIVRNAGTDIGTDTSNHVQIPAALMAKGQARFNNVCTGCHGQDAKGIEGSVPPLYHSDFLMANRHRPIHIQMMGLPNPFDTASTIVVNGDTFAGTSMPAQLGNDSEIAAVLTYVRATFNGATDFISVQEVAQVRDSLIAACAAHAHMCDDAPVESTH